jgi:transcriptional regulator with XRE-family HTH domain
VRSKTKKTVDLASLETVKQNITALRKKKGLTQTELGRKMGVSQRVVTYYENEAMNISWDAITSFAKALEIPTRKLLESSDENEEPDRQVPKALQKKLSLVARFSPADQQYIAKMIEMVAIKNGLSTAHQG